MNSRVGPSAGGIPKLWVGSRRLIGRKNIRKKWMRKRLTDGWVDRPGDPHSFVGLSISRNAVADAAQQRAGNCAVVHNGEM